MSQTPRTDAEFFSATTEKPSSGDYELQVVYADFAKRLEIENRDLRAQLQDLTAQLTDIQTNCDHEFVTEDHSFSHEFGTEKIFVCRCPKCGKDAEPGDMPDEDPPEREDDR